MTHAESYKEHGYLLKKHVFSPAEVEEVRRDAKAIFIAQMLRRGIVDRADLSEAEFEYGMFKLFDVDLQSFTNCGKHAQHLLSLHRLSLDPRIIDVVRELGLNFPNISTRPLLYFNSSRLAKKEVYWRLSMHQDWRSMQGSLDAIVAWIPLVPIAKALGALEVFPGSHRLGLLDANMEDGYGHIAQATNFAGAIPVEVDPGDILFFSALLVHQSGTNATESIRWSCHFRYNNMDESTFIARGFPHPYIYRPQAELITANFPQLDDINAVFGPRNSI